MVATADYYRLGRVYPRDQLRMPWERSGKRRFQSELYGAGGSAPEQTGGGWAEAVDIFIPGADSMSMFMAGADRAAMFVPGADVMEAT